MAGIDNNKTFEKARAKIHSIVDITCRTALLNAAYRLLTEAEIAKEYHNLTGNTLTSYAVGIYKNGALTTIIGIEDVDSLEAPTSRKLSRGNGIGVIYVEDYDSGRYIPVRKNRLMETDGDYGINTSKKFLRSYHPSTNLGWSIVMCTGTEYSTYLETVKGLNVLSETFNISPKILLSNLKPII